MQNINNHTTVYFIYRTVTQVCGTEQSTVADSR